MSDETINNGDMIIKINSASEKANTFTEMFFYKLSSIFEKNLSYYQIIINALFIFIVIIITYVIYLDFVNKESSKKNRCVEISNIYDANIKKTKPYFYNIYIVKDVFKKSLLTNFSIRISYDFIKEQTEVIFGKNQNIKMLTTSYSQIGNKKNIDTKVNAFTYFDLEKLEYDYIEYNDTEGEILYIDKNIITQTNFLFIITSDDDKFLKSNEAKQLVKFSKEFGYDNNKSVSPIYNILYAIDNHKNKDVV